MYPAGWAAKEDVQIADYELNSPFASNMCGHYFTERGHLKAARVELEQLARSGMTVLNAVARESERSGAIREIVCLKGRVGYGYRGFLDTVRNTAERRRCARLNVFAHILGVERDVRAERDYIKRQLAREHSGGTVLPSRASVAEIVPDILTACGNTVQMWLEALPPIPSGPHVVYPDIPLIALPATQPDTIAASGMESEAASRTTDAKEKPRWDEDTQELHYDGSVVKRFKQRAKNQVAVLTAFEEANWPRRMDDPIPPKDEIESKRRLRDTVEALNDCHVTLGKMYFRADGTGEGICWYDGPKLNEQRARSPSKA